MRFYQLWVVLFYNKILSEFKFVKFPEVHLFSMKIIISILIKKKISVEPKIKELKIKDEAIVKFSRN